MAYGSAVLTSSVIGWAERRVRRHRVDFQADAASPDRHVANGAGVEESAIRLHVDRARAGEREALGALIAAFRPDLLRLCTRMVGPVDAEDSTNDAFQRAQRRLDSYDTARPFKSWLLSIAAHHCVDRLRRRSLEKRLFDPDESDVVRHCR